MNGEAFADTVTITRVLMSSGVNIPMNVEAVAGFAPKAIYIV